MANTGAIRAGRAFVELFADNRKLVSGLRTAEYKVRAFGAKVKQIGMKMVAAGTAMLSPLIASAKVFGDFEKNMQMVSTMLTKPMQFMGKFSDGIRELSKDFGESTSVLSKGMYDILSASIDPAGALDVLKVAAKAAIGGMTDTAVAVDGITSVLNAFQMSAKMATHVSDVMFKGVKRGKFVYRELAEQIGRVAPMARAAGLSFTSMMAGIATMTRQGLGMDEAVTRMANILKQAPAASKDFVGLISKYVGKGLSEILIEFPEIRAATGIAALAGDIEGLVYDINLMNNASGAAEEAFQKMDGGQTRELMKLWQVIKDVALSVGEALAPAIKDFTKWLRSAGDAASKWITENKELVVLYAQMAVGITALGIALVVFGTLVGAAASIIGAFASVISLLLTPLGLVLALVVGVGYAIMQYTQTSGQALQWLGGTFDTLKNDATTAFQGISDALAAGSITQAAKILWLTLKLEWVRGTTALSNIWTVAVGFWSKILIGGFTVLKTTANVFVFGLEAALVGAANAFKRAWGGASDWVAKRLIDIRGLIDGSFDTVAAKASIDADAKARSVQMDADFADVGARFNAGIKESGEWNKEMRASIDGMTEADIAENEKALAAAIQERDNAVNQARQMRNNIRTPEGPPTPDTPGMPGLPEMPQMQLPDIGDMVKQEAAKITTRGTFSAFAAFGMGVGSGVEDRTAKASEETAKNTRQMLKEIRDGQMEFAQ